MNRDTYNTLTSILLGGSLIALPVAVAFLVAAILGWHGPNRKRRFVLSAIFVLAFPVLVGTHQAIKWRIFLPSLGREAERQRHDRVDAVSFVRIGDLAPSFTLTDTNGDAFVLDDLHGRVV